MNDINILEVARMDEESTSKVATDDESDGGSNPSTSSKKRGKRKSEELTTIQDPQEVKVESVESLFKLDYRKSNGMIRSDISKSIVYLLNVNWPDLIRVIPSDRWVTLNEIVSLVSEWENASPRKTFIRSRESIERGLSELSLAGVLLRS